MFIKMHEPGNYFSYLAALEERCELEDADRSAYFNYKNGWLGELKFYEFLSGVGGLKLWDVSLNLKGQVQYDFLVVYDGRVFHFDVKNFNGNYNYVEGNFVSSGGYVHKDVVPQLDRAHYKLGEFLRGTGYDCLSRVVFVNENFNVRGFHGDKKVMFHNGIEELRNYFKADYEPTDSDLKIAALFLDAHQPKTYHRIFYYPFDSLKSGVRCPKCRTIGMKKMKGFRSFECSSCGHKISTAEVVSLTMEEMMRLKNAPIKKAELMQWTGLGNTTCSRMLKDISCKHGSYKDAKYELKK